MLPLYLPLLGKDAFGLVALGVSTVQLVGIVNASMVPVFARDIAVRLKNNQPEYPVIRVGEILGIVAACIILLLHTSLSQIALGNADLGILDRSVASGVSFCDD